MTRFASADVRRLLAASAGDCVSIYMPTARTGRELDQNRIRLDDLVDQARRRLTDLGRSQAEVERTLGPNLGDRVGSHEAWSHPQEGLVVFVAEGRVDVFNVPGAFQERVVVGKRFHLRPMLRSTEREGRFYILAVGMTALRLFDADDAEVRQLHPDGLPTGLVTTLNLDDYLQSFDVHRSESTEQRGGVFNGQGGFDFERKETKIIQFFRDIDRRLSDFFGVERYPLVFAGPERLFPIFKETSHYAALLGECVPGNPDLLNGRQLHSAAWKLVEPIFDEDRRAAVERYLDRIATDLTTDDPATMLVAAERGQIGALLLREDAERWGRFDGERFEDSPLDDPRAEDLYDRLATLTLADGGRVFTVGADVLDDERPAGALLRNSLSSVKAGASEAARSRRSRA